MQILYGRPIAQAIKNTLTQRVSQHLTSNHYVVIFWLGDDIASKKYVETKQSFGQDIGLTTKVIGQEMAHVSYAELIDIIQGYNVDPLCVGIMCQLPLPELLLPYKTQILESIDPSKDIDGLTSIVNGKMIWGAGGLYPATVASILHILDYYQFGDVHNKTITIINQSNLIGKPLSMALVARGAHVTLIGKGADLEWIKQICRMSDILITATGVGRLISREYTNTQQIIIDAGVDFIDGKIVGDVDRDDVRGHITACTPCVGGVGPMTVASLFDNVRILQNNILS